MIEGPAESDLTTLAPASRALGTWQWEANDAAALRGVGAALAARFPAPRAVLLTGPLGAGKTTLAQGWLGALGVADPVKSPTFDLVHRHAAQGGTAYHVDLYRLSPVPPPEELDVPLPPADGSLVLVEWGEPWRRYAPQRVEVAIDFLSPAEGRRVVRVRQEGSAP